MHVLRSYWGDAILTVAYLINSLPTQVLHKKSPHQVFLGSESVFSIPPKVFGCVCFVHNHTSSRGKFDSRSLKCVFLGYSLTQKGYKCYHPPSRKWFASMNVTFFQSQSYFLSQSSLQGKPWCERIPGCVSIPGSSLVVENTKGEPTTSGGNTESNELKEGKVYVRDKDKQKIT
ncbi:hypothetical protein CsSME_00014590 [Camellia sinensis var. sinensis]